MLTDVVVKIFKNEASKTEASHFIWGKPGGPA